MHVEKGLQGQENNLLTGLEHSVPETNFSGMAVGRRIKEKTIAVIIHYEMSHYVWTNYTFIS